MFRICNTLCFSSVTIVTHARLDVTLYVHYLVVWVLILLNPKKCSTPERKCINIEVLQTAETNIAVFRGVKQCSSVVTVFRNSSLLFAGFAVLTKGTAPYFSRSYHLSTTRTESHTVTNVRSLL